MPDVLPDWDPSVDIRATTSVAVDVRGVYADCRLESDTVLRLGVVWSSEGTRLSGSGTSHNLAWESGSGPYDLQVDIPGTLIRQNLILSVQLLLASPSSSSAAPFAPALTGSRLAIHTDELIVEGIGARFPTEIVDFETIRLPTDAAWSLYWDPDDLHQTVAGDLRLYINARNPLVVRAISENRRDDRGIREAIRYDIAQRMIYGALSNPEFVVSPDSYEVGTIGAAVRSTIRTYFPNIPIKWVRDLAQRPDTFNPRLQERLRLFWEDSDV